MINDDIVVQKILKLLENNTAFIGYALNGGIGTKINVRNTETGKTIQALSVNVDSSGEVLVVKDSADGQYKAVTFKTAEQVSERIIQLRKTKPINDKKTIEYTDSDIEVFYLFVKLIDTGSPVPTQLQSTWIRKGSSCTQFVGAYERCNYARRETIGGTFYTGLPYTPYTSLSACLNDDNGPDAKTPHGSKDESGGNAGWRYFSTKVSAAGEASMLAALTSHDAKYNTSYKKLFGYGSILECSGAINIQGWESGYDSQTGQYFTRCAFSYLPGYTLDCTPAMQAAGYCDSRGFISSRCPQYDQQAPGQPGIGNIDSSWNAIYGWKDLPYEFMYKRHFGQMYLNGSTAPGSFYILEVNDDQIPPNLPSGYFPWVPGCPSGGNGGPYDGSGGNRFPDGVAPIQKRDMKLSTHKAEIWLGSSKKEEAIKLYELGASDLFSGMYNAFILAANESIVDRYKRANINTSVTTEEQLLHDTFYKNWNKNIIDLRINPRVWIYTIDNIPKANYIYPAIDDYTLNPSNPNIQWMVDHLYNRTINLTVIDKDTQIVHLKLGLTPKSNLSNTDCKGVFNGFGNAVPANELTSSQSWEYQKYVTIKIKKGKIESTTNTLDTTLLANTTWNKEYINKKFLTSFGSPPFNFSGGSSNNRRDLPNNVILMSSNTTSFNDLISGNNYEQFNYSQAKIASSGFSHSMTYFVNSSTQIKNSTNFNENQRRVLVSTGSWWALWDRSMLDNTKKRFSSIVGYDKNVYQIATSFGLDKNLNYRGESYNNRQVTFESFFEYLPTKPKLYIPSTIRSVRSKLVDIRDGTLEFYLSTRERTLNQYGVNHFHSDWETRWSSPIQYFRLDGNNASDTDYGDTSGYYNYGNLSYSVSTKEKTLFDNFYTGNGLPGGIRGMDTRSWFNNLWAQLIYDGFIKVDVDSYKDVEFKLPTNPSKYIKYTTFSSYANTEYPFVIYNAQELETVLSPGKLDITKQVPIKKPTNVNLDPNLSFLLYIFPYITVTKKKKEI